jgi:RNA polymerase sigma factor (sigma-70 family)
MPHAPTWAGAVSWRAVVPPQRLPAEADPTSPGDASVLQRDRRWLAAWAAGDQAAGAALLDHYVGHARRVALRHGVRPGAEFEDFWQDLVLRLLQHLPDLAARVHHSFAGFLAWQVRHQVRGWRRHRVAGSPLAFDPAAPLEPDPGVRAAFWAALAECRSALPPREQVVFEHRFLGGLDLAAVAAEVGSNANAVAQSVFRLVRRLRECLAKKGFDAMGGA